MAIRAPQSRRALIPFFVLLGSCQITDPDVEANGVVRFHDVEGGCWAIEASGETLEPINLPGEFQVDGLSVVFEATVRTDLATICQVGRIVELDFIQIVE